MIYDSRVVSVTVLDKNNFLTNLLLWHMQDMFVQRHYIRWQRLALSSRDQFLKWMFVITKVRFMFSRGFNSALIEWGIHYNKKRYRKPK